MEFKVKDINLAEWGRKEIMLAEQEMPGLMAVREGVCEEAARSKGFEDCWVVAHDDSDGRADRDADGARGLGALVLVQHFFDAGSCGRGRGDWA